MDAMGYLVQSKTQACVSVSPDEQGLLQADTIGLPISGMGDTPNLVLNFIQKL